MPVPESAEQTVAIVMDAWVRNDRLAAERFALPEAVDALFDLPRPAAAPAFDECESVGTGQWHCSYFDDSGTFVLVVIQEAESFVVERAEYFPD